MKEAYAGYLRSASGRVLVQIAGPVDFDHLSAIEERHEKSFSRFESARLASG
jgi:hypothetical protein